MGYDIHIACSFSEKEAIYKFRYQVYIGEMSKYHVNADHKNKLLYDDADDHMVLYYAVSGDQLSATVRSQRGPEGKFLVEESSLFGIDKFEQVFDHNCIAIVDRLIVDQRFRRSTLAHEMMLRTYIDGWKAGTRLCFITCDDQLLPMYLRYGFRIYREPVVLASGECRHRLLLFLCDKQHLQRVRSPFLSHLPDQLDDHGSYAALAKEKLSLTFYHHVNYMDKSEVIQSIQ